MISAFPPLRDGIGKYAAAEVAELRAEGHDVEVLSPVPCAAHYVENLQGGLRPLAVRRHATRYDRAILQYHPSRFHRARFGLDRALSDLAMLLLYATTPNLTVVCHEIDYPPEPFSRSRPEILFERLAWKWAHHVAFHTEQEVRMLRERFGVRPRRVTLREQVAHAPLVRETQAEARRRLGLEAGPFIFLCIGFIQAHKGFDRAVRALGAIPGEGLRLYVVGSLRTDTREHGAHLEELRRLAAADRRVVLREDMVSDAEFDRWIVAADRVLLPYREIWSSAVLQRVKLLGTPAIVSAVGGLPEQAGEKDVVVASDAELRRAMAEAAGPASAAPAVPLTPEDAQAYVEAEAQRRRGESGRGVDLEEQIRRLETERLFLPEVLPSTRPLLGPLITVTKRVVRRVIRPLLTPLLEQENAYHDQLVRALRELARRERG